jgi:hypothetical protein
VALTFPKDYFERFSYYAGVSCAICNELYIFGITNMIFLKPKPANAIASGAVATVTISNLINPAYRMTGTIALTGYTRISDKQDKTYGFLLTRDVAPCAVFSGAASVANSNIGGQNNVTFTFNFITGHPIPTSGALSIFFPAAYGASLIQLNASCALIGFPAFTPATCKIGASNRADIYLNGELLS